jgi:GNAT superfamily N-acetyltransferase
MVKLTQLAAVDWERLRAIRLRALLDAPDAFGSTFNDAAARSPESWSKQLLDMPTFVAASDGVDVGVVRCAPDESRTDTAWLISMWVAPEARHKGIAGVLVDAVIEHARAKGVARVLLDVADNNAPAIALYARKGFQPNGAVGALPPPRQHVREHQRELWLSATRKADR